MRFKKIKIPKAIPLINPLALRDILFRKDTRTQSFLELDSEIRIEMLNSLTRPVKRDILMHIPEKDLVEILQSVDPDDATDLLQILGPKKREKTLLLLSEDMRDSLSTLLEFDADTAAGLMTLDYIQADVEDRISDVAKKFRQHEQRTGRPPVILTTKDGKHNGFLPGHELGFARPSETIAKYIKRIPSISFAASYEEVSDMFSTHPHGKVVVLNDGGDVIGIIYSDDVLKLLQENEGSSLYDFAGIRKEESVTDPANRKIKNRYRWLIINLGTAFLASFVVSRFQDTLSKYVLLAVYMPIVAGMGGNSATQTLAVLVRGIALKQIELKTAWRTLRSELGASVANGLINGVLV
ncbi:MAG: hypothetical protein JWO47_177, partial [Candidatus Saccharibacteria bacterium]|nr:hypothetical protein [Candidatus Saccharibacteria bacterium]